MSDQWPEFPKDQIALPDLGSDPPKPNRDAAHTNRPQKPQVNRRTVICRECGNERTFGLPCPTCEGVK